MVANVIMTIHQHRENILRAAVAELLMPSELKTDDQQLKNAVNNKDKFGPVLSKLTVDELKELTHETLIDFGFHMTRLDDTRTLAHLPLWLTPLILDGEELTNINGSTGCVGLTIVHWWNQQNNISDWGFIIEP